jgi:branched-chain amino acid transport system permease protein
MALPLEIRAGSTLDHGWRLGRALGLVLLIVALPYMVQTFRLGQITSALILAIAVVGLNLLSGFAGQISLGHAAFFGIGAYTTGVITACSCRSWSGWCSASWWEWLWACPRCASKACTSRW